MDINKGLTKCLKPVAKAERVSVEELKRRLAVEDPFDCVFDWFFRGLLGQNIAQIYRVVALARGEILREDAFVPRALVGALRQNKHVVLKEISYRSSIDDIYPLYAEIAYDSNRENMPIVVIQHGGYLGSRFGMVPSCYRMAKKGFFAIAVSKRGRDGSAGVGDSWCKEIFDIIYAVEFVKKEYAEYVDPTNVNIWGYSGGSLGSMAAAVRFPDYFRSVNCFFSQLQWNRGFSGETAEIDQSTINRMKEYDKTVDYERAFREPVLIDRPDSNLQQYYLIMKGIGDWPEEVFAYASPRVTSIMLVEFRTASAII